MYLIKGHIISLLHFALSTSSFTVLILLNILYSCTLSGSGNKIKSNQTFGIQLYNSSIKKRCHHERLIYNMEEVFTLSIRTRRRSVLSKL